MLKNYNNWCPEVYRSVFIDHRNDDMIYVSPCCQAHGKIESSVGFSFDTSPTLNKIRDQFNHGQRAPECERCWRDEDLGKKSRRQSAIEFFSIKPSTEVKLESIDHSATWACNLACIMCGPASSSTWARELELSRSDLQQMGRLFQKKNPVLESLDLTALKKIHFNGGEPLLNQDQLRLFNQLKEINRLDQVFISYNSNGTIYPSSDLIELWKQTKLVKIFFSIDAIGPAFEYIRWPARWKDTEKNILKMRDDLPTNVVFGFNVTLGSYNLLEFPETIKWFNDNLRTNREGDASDFCYQFAYNFDTAELSKEVIDKAVEKLQDFEEAAGVISYILGRDAATMTWQSKLDTIDKRRGTDWRQSLKLSEYY